MKKSFLFAVALIISAGAEAGPALNVAQNLTQTLRTLSQQSDQVAQRARFNGNYQRARKFTRLSNASSDLARGVRFNVVRPLRNHNRRRAKMGMQSLRSEFRHLNQIVSNIYRVPPRVQDTLQRKTRQAQRLRSILNQGGGHGPGGLIKCTAVDNGWEEHFGGHSAYGRTIYEAQRAAIRSCERVHGSCRISRCGRAF